MRADSQVNREATLADLIWSLEAGRPCPWCGERLRSGCALQDQGKPVSDQAGAEGEVVTLHCPRCGCRVMWGNGCGQSVDHDSLASAA